MRLIDVDELKRQWGYGNECDKCQRDSRKCQYEEITRMDVCSMLDDAPTITPKPGWISVKDRLPEKPGRYLVCAKEGERETHRTIAPFQRAFHLTGRMAYWKVTHWMPLPELPKEE